MQTTKKDILYQQHEIKFRHDMVALVFFLGKKAT